MSHTFITGCSLHEEECEKKTLVELAVQLSALSQMIVIMLIISVSARPDADSNAVANQQQQDQHEGQNDDGCQLCEEVNYTASEYRIEMGETFGDALHRVPRQEILYT